MCLRRKERDSCLIKATIVEQVNRALVTGGDGFLGKALVRRLRLEGAFVCSLGRIDGDISEAVTFEKLPKVDVVYHLAGRTFVPDSWLHPEQFMCSNVIGTQNVINYCNRCGAKLVYASAYIYGIPKLLPIDESHEVQANNPYAMSKYLAEQLCSFGSRYLSVPTTVLRIFNVYGPGQKSDFLIPTIVKQVLFGEKVKVKDLSPRRDYVYIDDLVDALIRAGNSLAVFDLFNLGSGQSNSVAELIAAVQLAAGTSLPVVVDDTPRQNEILDVVADCSRAREVLGWLPRTSIEDGMRLMVATAREVVR
jgi:GDP-4-dehydro-6-deoxy-D-mannose reductase